VLRLAIFNIEEEKHFPMYYLVIQNLGVERCIHLSEDDIYQKGMSFSCTPDLEFRAIHLIRAIPIICSEVPDPPLMAKVYRD